MAEQSTTSNPRLKFENGMLIAPDTGEMFVYNPSKPGTPMMTVRIMDVPDEYFGIWITDEMAQAIGQPGLAGKPSKKFLHPKPGRRIWDSDLAYDDLIREGFKGSWKGDIEVQIIPADGNLKGTETTYSLTLPTTSLIEFKGASRAPDKGSVSEFNFIHKLAQFAIESALDANENASEADLKKAVLDAMTVLPLGGVAAEIRSLKAENKERGQSWMVLSFTPVHIEPLDADLPALPSGTGEESGDVPF